MNHQNIIMKLKALWLIIAIFCISTSSDAQHKKKVIKISGTVTDIDNKALHGAMIFIDSIKTKVKTNKKGFYKIKINPEISEVAIFVKGQGLLAKKYNREKVINFVFRTDKTADFQEDMVIGMGYSLEVNKVSDNFNTGGKYTDFATIYEILDRKFPFVKVRNGRIKIGNGPNSFTGDDTPLIFIDDMRVNEQTMAVVAPNDIKKIRVIRRGSEAAIYGGLAASNGVILIDLKKGN